jgi:hypothetical protein
MSLDGDVDLNEEWTRLDRLLGTPNPGVDSQFRTALRRLVDRLGSLATTFVSLHDGVTLRQQLIELHCQERPVSYQAHVAYHEVGKRVQSELLGFFAAIKTYLNALSVFIGEVLPQSLTRALRFRGFGSLVDSACRTAGRGLPLDPLRHLLASEGASYYSTFVEYRNKNLEHPTRLTDITLCTGPGSAQIMHSLGVPSSPGVKGDSLPPPSEERVVVFRTEAGGTAFVYHIAPSAEVDEGSALAQGQPMGRPCDCTGRHFLEYGIHFHVFDSADLHHVQPAGAWQPLAQITFSPNAYDAMVGVVRLTRGVLDLVSKEGHSSPEPI